MSAFARFVLVLAILVAPATAFAQFDFTPSGKPGSTDAWAEREDEFGFLSRAVVETSIESLPTIEQGGNLPVALTIDLKPGWHVWTNPRELPEGVAVFMEDTLTNIELQGDAPAGVTVGLGNAVWPDMHEMVANYEGEMKTYAVFEGTSPVYIPIQVADDAPLGEMTLTFVTAFQSCDDNGCKAPDEEQVSITFEIVAAGAGADTELTGTLANFPMDLFGSDTPLSTTAQTTISANGATGANITGGFLGLLFLAGIGGILLNFTPCVLPVIPIKIMGLSHSAGGNRRKTMVLGLAMAAGVIAFWMVLGTLVATISNFSTNQLFQIPAFSISVGVVIAILSIGMCGLFAIQLPQKAYAFNPSHDTLTGSFLFGIMAAVLSTPCTAPFMGTAITASIGRSSVFVLLVFFAIGLGMSLPYLILSANPKLIEKMPRTGPASELLKQIMGLLMLAVAAYFIGIGVSGLLQQPGFAASRAYWYFVGFFSAVAGGWLLYRTFRLKFKIPSRLFCTVVSVFMVGFGVYFSVIMTAKGPIEWIYYTPERLQAQLDEGNPVLLKFTAEWCANCHLLERSVVDRPEVVAHMAASGIIPMKVDITSGDAVGNELLNEYWKSIPYLVLQRPDGTVVYKADWYTVNDLLSAFDEASSTPMAINTN
ncbi:MAG: thioredoxin family protein [Planctomycetota bacterium]